ncbi:YceI family protein [Segniliparus rugosus]|uniref:Lipid/polyisoprenoid-binding YceI-like domain-containing protein n=1 Tax=Segniliparus rugosus (strain ATCC BAA-974 / DSM 45345 / CCUG 50838 / CIP 108380 / JCM 13579 / CDC 945) TaxID=679197 RepID=E5XTK0_SEGRC|nr:YceI family protein [Segniliparus rugosus]EFV12315.1 hypothetical protein HMPREF9336_02822 [Segniliparus rugosus ATCC BAA-974]
MTATIPGLTQGTWTIDPVHSEVTASIRHLGVSKVRASFAEFSGAVTVAEDGAPAVVAEIAVGSIDTKNEARDTHVKSADFFDVATYPTASFRSTGVQKDGDDYIVSGDFTLHGVTKPIELRLEFGGVAQNPQTGGSVAGFSATTTIGRSDFGISAAPGLLGEKVAIELDIEAALA